MSRKLIQKLKEKKYREEMGLFLVEGEKSIQELLNSDFVIRTLLVTPDTFPLLKDSLENYQERFPDRRIEILNASEESLTDSGTRESNNAGIAIAEIKKPIKTEEVLGVAQKNLVLVLDTIRDPGNLGTIIRTADWFGVTHIVASETTTDFYNPKTIAASMGSFTRVHVIYTSLLHFLHDARVKNIDIFGTFLDGVPVHTYQGATSGLIVMGSESHGIGDDSASLVSKRITIPQHGGAESLNVGVATGIILAALRA